MNSETLTHKDLSQVTGVSVTTIKSYRKKFPEFFIIAGHGKPLRFRKGADKLCLRIRELFLKNLSTKQIREKLLIEFESVRDNISSTKEKEQATDLSSIEKLSETTLQMMNGLAALVTTQAKTEQRLNRIEKKLEKIVDSSVMQTKDSLLSEIKNLINGNEHQDIKSSVEQLNNRARKKILSRPDSDFMALPIVIKSEEGGFFGLPAKDGNPFTLKNFVKLLSSDITGQYLPVWKNEDSHWVMTYQSEDSPLYEIIFTKQITSKGNSVSLIDKLFLDGVKQNLDEQLVFFKKIHDLL